MNEFVFSAEFELARLEDLKGRVSDKRLRHIMGVADTAERLAQIYDADTKTARLAGLLHDWDKGYNNEEISSRARNFGLEPELGTWLIENMPQVLHGPTAACALSAQFPEIPPEVIRAIKYHTTANEQMSALDKILYVADAIEPSRKFERAERFRQKIGVLSLDDLYYSVYKFWTLALIEHDVVLHPDTIRIYNSLAQSRA
jgi:predicted HD superfamily hydrolase involved in NAD metabolism